MAAEVVRSANLDPYAPLRSIETEAGPAHICQRVGCTLFVRWPDGREQQYPAGFSLEMVAAEIVARRSEV